MTLKKQDLFDRHHRFLQQQKATQKQYGYVTTEKDEGVDSCTLKSSMEALRLQPQGFLRSVFHGSFCRSRKDNYLCTCVLI